MSTFSEKSLSVLATCHPQLQELAHEVVKSLDCACVSGYRTEEEQAILYAARKSQVKISKHNSNPSQAMDLVPCIKGLPTWNRMQAYFFAGRVVEIAKKLGIPIRAGADWDSDNDVIEHSFQDPTHFEIIP